MKRVLITGIDSFWGARVAQALEKDPGIEVLIGMGVEEPPVELYRTETIKADESYSLVSRIVRATKVDTIIHTFLIVDPRSKSAKQINETNVIGTMNLLAAAGGANSSVRQFILKSSTIVYGSRPEDPSYFTEEMPAKPLPQSLVAKTILDAESYLKDFANDNPHVLVSLLRFSNVLGTDIKTTITKNLSRSFAPMILGFDPLMQFVEEDDVIRSIEFVAKNEIAGIYNVAGDHPIPWSDVLKLAGCKPLFISAIGTSLISASLKILRLADLSADLIELLKYGRGVDNSKLKKEGFSYRYDTPGAVLNFAKARRLKKQVGQDLNTYKYQKDVELFFRHSPAVDREAARELF